MSNIMSSIPTNGAQSSFLNGGGPGSTGILSTSEDFYTWLDRSVLSAVFQDEICGDGVCDSPEEQPGLGRFGW
jgi:hypothetical protein